MSLDAMKQALEVLEEAVFYTSSESWSPSMTRECETAITALRAAIEQRKPVAWRKNYQNSGYTYFDERWGTIPDDAEPLFSN